MTEEVESHFELCHDDKEETSEVQAERIQRQRRGGDCRVSHQGRRVMITVDKVLQDASEQSQLSGRLHGDGNVAMSPDRESEL